MEEIKEALTFVLIVIFIFFVAYIEVASSFFSVNFWWIVPFCFYFIFFVVRECSLRKTDIENQLRIKENFK